MTKPSDLVQGTLDLLLLKILALQPLSGFAISQRLKQISGDILQATALSIPLCTSSNRKAGSPPNGSPAKTTGGPSSIRSRGSDGDNWKKRLGNWNRLSAAISQIVKLKEA